MEKQLPSEVEKMLERFGEQFRQDYAAALKSGALPSDRLTPVEIARCVIGITAEKFGPLHPSLKKHARNLAHFI